MTEDTRLFSDVEDFVKRWNEGEIILSPKANTMVITFFDEEKNFWGKPKPHKKKLPDYLGWAIAAYQANFNSDSPRVIFSRAYELLDTIQRARAFGLILDTKTKVADYEKQIENLKEQNAKLRELNSKLALENKRLHNLVGKTEVGDVEEKK